ncbi:MAG: urate hydroxylase PuuD, partial [Pseudomonadota bacterium]
HYGALIGTIMVANVAHIIIPGQKRMVAALTAGEPINPQDGARGKQRSVHNTYLTLPVLFIMISNHYASTYSSEWNWLILIGMTIAGALIRVYFVARHKGNASPLPAIGGLVALAATAFITNGLPTLGSTPNVDATAVSLEHVQTIVTTRCTGCHAAEPSWPGFASAPAGIMLERAEDIEK